MKIKKRFLCQTLTITYVYQSSVPDCKGVTGVLGHWTLRNTANPYSIQGPESSMLKSCFEKGIQSYKEDKYLTSVYEKNKGSKKKLKFFVLRLC